jgi:hypothetical protein
VSVQSYGALTVVRTEEGPMIEGEIPNRIGLHPDILLNPPADGVASGAWKILDGELTILHTRWRQIGMDGDVTVFERIDA